MLDELLSHLWQHRLLRFPALPAAAHADVLRQADVGETDLRKLIRQHAPNSRAKQQAVLHSLARVQRAVIFFDSLEKPSPTALAFLQALAEVATLAAATTAPERKESHRRFWALFIRIDLAPLLAPIAERLLDHYLGAYPIYPTDRRLFRRTVLAAAAGNPAHLQALLADAERQRIVGLDEIRAIGGSQAGEYFNLSPVYVFGLLVFSLAKIVTGGTAPGEFYVILSVGSIVVMLVLRIFRVFFVFRLR